MPQHFRRASRGAFPEGYYENPGSEAAVRRNRATGESIAVSLTSIREGSSEQGLRLATPKINICARFVKLRN